MNRRIAALHLARRYPDFDSLAGHMKKRPDTLRKELSGVDGYKWGVEDEELLVMLCIAAKVFDPLAPITAAAVNAGAMLIPLPERLGGGSPTFKCLADSAQEFAVFVSSVAGSVADDDVTAVELREAEKRFGALVSSGQACLSSLSAMHEACKPAHLRNTSASTSVHGSTSGYPVSVEGGRS